MFKYRAGAAALLLLMGLRMLNSAWNDSATYDEPAHIAAGYSYLTKHDYRLNPEQPPLVKDLAALPLLLIDLHAVWDRPSWSRMDQYRFGEELLYESGNNADRILRISRATVIALTLILGWGIFCWARSKFGPEVALLALFLYSSSPTVLAHGRLVTMDVAAAAGLFFATIAFLQYLQNARMRTMVVAGVVLGAALLTKFSVFVLIPMFICTAILESVFVRKESPRSHRFLGISMIIIFAAAVVYFVYAGHIYGYPAGLQLQTTRDNLQGRGVGGSFKRAVIWSSDKPGLRPIAAYFDGLFVTVQRTATGNSFSFLGSIRSHGSLIYFPLVYLIKEPLAFHALTILAVLFFIGRFRRHPSGTAWIAKHFPEFTFVSMLTVYWLLALRSQLDIGVRHLLPVLPFTYIVVSIGVAGLLRQSESRALLWLVVALILWQGAETMAIHPSYLAYFNELAGGPDNGYRFVIDSNLDWGQDLKRLAMFVDDRRIDRIYLEYFGGGSPAYYLGDKVIENGCGAPAPGWLAVSMMDYSGSPWRPDCDYRRWLPPEAAVRRIGHSIIVFHVPQ
jgi:hypothetical protein